MIIIQIAQFDVVDLLLTGHWLDWNEGRVGFFLVRNVCGSREAEGLFNHLLGLDLSIYFFLQVLGILIIVWPSIESYRVLIVHPTYLCE